MNELKLNFKHLKNYSEITANESSMWQQSTEKPIEYEIKFNKLQATLDEALASRKRVYVNDQNKIWKSIQFFLFFL